MLSVWSEVQTCIWPSWCHCHSLSLASVKSRLVLPYWYRLTGVVPDKGPLNGCVCVCVSLSQWCSQSSRDAEARDQWTRRDDLLPISSVHVLWTNLKAAFTPHGAVAFSGERGFIPRRVVVKTKQHAPRHSTLWTQLNSRISSMHPQSYMYW